MAPRNSCLIAAAAVALATAAASGQTINGGEVNISGATLFANFFPSPASTNDFIDVDGDGTFGFNPAGPIFVDQLATGYTNCGGFTTWWLVQYRGVGSVNGFGEFIDYQLLGTIPQSIPGELGVINRVTFAQGGVAVPTGCGQCNPSNTPFCPSSIDLGVLDVPGRWAVRQGEAANGKWDQTPGANGYGFNFIPSNTGYISELQSLTRGQMSLNTNTANPDGNTVFDTAIAWVPIVYIANRGTGVQRLRMTELQHLFVAGRLPNGENLVAATRSAGSGTRNGIMNTSGIDPAWGRGDNIGNENAVTSAFNLGPNTQPTNGEGSSQVEQAVINWRLAVGYTGLAGSSRAVGDALAGRYEIIDVMFNDRGGNQYVRPTIDTVIDNANPNTGFQLGGPETFTSRGNPLEMNPAAPTYMDNQHAADYLRNILGSIASFSGNPPGEVNFNMPGELLALTFFLLDGIDALPNAENPTLFEVNPGLNLTLQEFIRDENGLGVGGDTPPYGSVNIANLVPIRNVNPAGYSDGSTNGDYKDAANNNIVGGTRLAERNQISGDFGPGVGGDGVRNINDIDRLMLAISNPRAFEQNINHGGNPGAQPGDYAIPEVIGDFNGDGDFNSEDVRYFADGLALQNGLLNRTAGFTRVDTAWAALPGGDGNYFNTVLATGAPYQAGDSRADVAGSVDGPVAGGPPTGADGVIDAQDIDYICANMGDWSDIDQAPFIDLSCDMNGDFVIDGADIAVIVEQILETEFGDVNLDGARDGADLAIVDANLGMTPAGWADGDMNCDNIVDSADRQIVLGGCDPCDTNCDGVIDAFDIEPFIAILLGGQGCSSCAADVDGSGTVDSFDIEPFINCLVGP